jgi:two-component system, OmpR family, alkaline phosphatase synthesis response regulator PhoP
MTGRVLVVDDDPRIVAVVRTTLERQGLEIATASNGAECLLAVGASPPNVIVLDVTMPIMDGWQVLRVLRESPATADLPVIMLTAHGEDDAVARGLEAGAHLYLTKPFNTEELLAAVTRLLEPAEG